MLKKLIKVLGIVALTVVGLLGIAAIHLAVVTQRVPVGLDFLANGMVSVNNWDNGFVHARGTWVIDGERSGTPLNTVDIKCFRDQKHCYVAEAHVSNGRLNAYGELYEITRWDATTLEYQTDAVCVRALSDKPRIEMLG